MNLGNGIEVRCMCFPQLHNLEAVQRLARQQSRLSSTVILRDSLDVTCLTQMQVT